MLVSLPAVVLAACAAGEPTAQAPGPGRVPPTPIAEPSGPITPPPAPGPQPGSTAPEPVGWREVIVDLAVDWRPEAELTPDQVQDQRARIEGAQDALVADLGAHARLRRRFDATPQMAVSVNEQGSAILAASPLVARVHADRDDAPTGT